MSRIETVIASGSVILLLRQPILCGGPATVPHPEVTLFFMTLPESCRLIGQAGASGQGGELFILEMGTPVKIADMPARHCPTAYHKAYWIL